MTVLESLGDYIDAQTSLTLGTDLFLARLPSSPDACVAVYEYAGNPPSEMLGTGAYAVDRPRIQVLVRGSRDDYPGARDRAQTIRGILAALTDTTVSGVRILRVSSVGAVNPLGADENDRPLVSVNFDVTVAV